MEIVDNEPENVKDNDDENKEEENDGPDESIYIVNENYVFESDDGAGCLTVVVCALAIPAVLFWHLC